MKKMIWIALAALGFSASALAGDIYEAPSSDFVVGPYIGVQGGFAETGVKDLLDCSAETFVDIFGTVHSLDQDVKDGNWGIRPFIGYDFSPNWAAEFGWTYFDSNKVNVNLDGEKVGDYKVKTYAFDLVAKMTVPVSDGLGIYAKAGPGYLRNKADDHGVNEKVDNINLVYGLGASYDITPNWKADVSWTRYAGVNKTKCKDDELFGGNQRNADLYAIGFAYKFEM